MSPQKLNGIAVMQTDGVTRDGHRSTWQALFHTLFDNWHLGVPMLFSHDIHRPIGWSRPFALHLEPGIARLVASIFRRRGRIPRKVSTLHQCHQLEAGGPT